MKQVEQSNDSSTAAADDLPPGLAKPARRALDGAGITSLDQLSTRSESEVLKLHGMGPKALNHLREALAAKGLSSAHRDTAIAAE